MTDHDELHDAVDNLEEVMQEFIDTRGDDEARRHARKGLHGLEHARMALTGIGDADWMTQRDREELEARSRDIARVVHAIDEVREAAPEGETDEFDAAINELQNRLHRLIYGPYSPSHGHQREAEGVVRDAEQQLDELNDDDE